MSPGFLLVVALLVVFVLLGLPTRRRLERAFTPRSGPGRIALLRERLRAASRARSRRRRKRRGDLRSV